MDWQAAFIARARAAYTRTYWVNAPQAAVKPYATLLDVTELRDSSTNPSVFAPGTTKTDYSAFSVAAVDAQTRTRVAIVVRDDTDVSRRIGKVRMTDKLHVRGTAFHTSRGSGLSIVVDSFEVLGA